MRAVLRNGDGFFTRMGENKFYLRRAETSSDLQDATVFDVSIVDGKPAITPEPPEGNWEVRAVTFDLIPDR